MEQVPQPGFVPGAGVFILNEGGFGFGNASLSYYNFADESVDQEVFQEKSGQLLGDVLQAGQIIDGKLVLCLNNSNHIKIIDLPALELEGIITDLPSPRYIASNNKSVGFVTDLYANRIHQVDLDQRTIINSIPVQHWTEELIFANDLLFVCQRLSNFLLVVDPTVPAVLDSIPLTYDPSAIQKDRDGNLWVYCSGNPTESVLGGVYKIDPNTLNILQVLPFEIPESLGWPRMAMNAEKDLLFILQNDLFKVPINASSFPNAPFISGEDRTFYGLGINPVNDEIFLGDAIDFQQKGKVYRYSSDGTLLDEFESGVIPNGFIFY